MRLGTDGDAETGRRPALAVASSVKFQTAPRCEEPPQARFRAPPPYIHAPLHDIPPDIRTPQRYDSAGASPISAASGIESPGGRALGSFLVAPGFAFWLGRGFAAGWDASRSGNSWQPKRSAPKRATKQVRSQRVVDCGNTAIPLSLVIIRDARRRPNPTAARAAWAFPARWA